MHVRLWTLAAVPLLALGLGPAALGAQNDDQAWLKECRENWGGSGEPFCEVRELRLRASRAPITVDGRQNGGVQVEGSAGEEILVRARIQTRASSDEDARELAKAIRVETSGGTIRAEGPGSGRGESWAVSYRISAPRRSDLSIETNNGPIAVSGISGRMELRAVNGPVALSEVGGNVRARTTNGPLEIELAGRSWDGAGLDAETTNGPVSLSIPEGYSARLETGTVNGPLDIDIPITLQGRISRRITTTLGQGGAPVRAITTNGPVVIRRQ